MRSLRGTYSIARELLQSGHHATHPGVRATGFAMVLAACAPASSQRLRNTAFRDVSGTVTVRNRTRGAIVEMRFRRGVAGPWSADVLRGTPLCAGCDMTLRNQRCEEPDRRIDIALRGDGDARCVIENMAICAENYGFTLTAREVERCLDWP